VTAVFPQAGVGIVKFSRLISGGGGKGVSSICFTRGRFFCFYGGRKTIQKTSLLMKHYFLKSDGISVKN
jgi:hypothetical protein